MNKYTKKMNAEGTCPVSAAAAQGTAAPGLLEAEQGTAESRRGRGRNGSDTSLAYQEGPRAP